MRLRDHDSNIPISSAPKYIHVYFSSKSDGVLEGVWFHCKGFFRSGLGTIGDTISITGEDWVEELYNKCRTHSRHHLFDPQPCAYDNAQLAKKMMHNKPQPKAISYKRLATIEKAYPEYPFSMVVDGAAFADVLLYSE